MDSGVPVDFKYLSVIESGLANAVSPSDARGFWQFMEPAAEEFGLRVDRDVDERYHVEKATRAACAYLNEAHRRYGDWILAAASYNMGMSGLSRRLDQQQGVLLGSDAQRRDRPLHLPVVCDQAGDGGPRGARVHARGGRLVFSDSRSGHDLVDSVDDRPHSPDRPGSATTR